MSTSKEFRERLQSSKTNEEIRNTSIMTIFWNYMERLNLENGQSIKIQEVIDVIFENLNKQICKESIEEQIKIKLESKKYIYRLSDNNEEIKLELSKSEDLQWQYQKRRNDSANKKMNDFIQIVESQRRDLENKKIKVTRTSLMQQFSKDEIEKNPRWIDLAIDKVLKFQEGR